LTLAFVRVAVVVVFVLQLSSFSSVAHNNSSLMTAPMFCVFNFLPLLRFNPSTIKKRHVRTHHKKWNPCAGHHHFMKIILKRFFFRAPSQLR
jgi:hypothetical protein